MDYEECSHNCDEYCWEDDDPCLHQHCFACGGCECPGYCDDYQTYNLRGYDDLDPDTGKQVSQGN